MQDMGDAKATVIQIKNAISVKEKHMTEGLLSSMTKWETAKALALAWSLHRQEQLFKQL